MASVLPSKFLSFSIALFCFAASTSLFANGLVLRCIRATDTSATISIAWQHGWNNPTPAIANHDAIWIFAKASLGTDDYKHLLIRSSRIVSGSISFVDSLVPSGQGLFLKVKPGTSFKSGACDLELAFSTRPTTQSVQFFGVEMVFVPPDPFFIGDSASNLSFADSSGAPLYSNSFLAPSAKIFELGASPSLEYSIPYGWPTGERGFYCMKYELDQLAYANFLNTIGLEKRSTRANRLVNKEYAFSLVSAQRNGLLNFGQNTKIAFDGNFNQIANEESDGQHRAANFLAWPDLLAWLDWACLRPITEFEFEKAARGPAKSLPKGYAWGTQLAANTFSISRDGYPEEAAKDAPLPNIGRANFGGLFGTPYLNGPMRTGFAASDTSGRVESGASHYGIFELSGNLWEQCVKLAPASNSFLGTTGDGNLDASGNANTDDWPSPAGAIVRGGGCNSLLSPDLSYRFRDLAISDRFYSTYAPATRLHTTGGRGGR